MENENKETIILKEEQASEEINHENREEIEYEEKKGFKQELLDFVKDFAIIIIIVYIIRSFFVLPFQINGQSMADSYYDREFIIVDRFSYIISKPKRWDVIVFRPHVSEDKEFFIKRIIGTPWDKIMIKDGDVFLFNTEQNAYVKLDEWYLSNMNNGSTFVWTAKDEHIYEVPENSYFVMGDNRLASTDSRTCFRNCSIEGRTNYIVKSDIIGRVFIDLWYFNIWDLNFIHPTMGIDTHPRFFSSPSHYIY